MPSREKAHEVHNTSPLCETDLQGRACFFLVKVAVERPTRRPELSSSAPPELPELMAASVCPHQPPLTPMLDMCQAVMHRLGSSLPPLASVDVHSCACTIAGCNALQMQAGSSGALKILFRLGLGSGTWMAPPESVPPGEGMARFSPETTPVVSVCDRPDGLPMANTVWPTRRSLEVPTCRSMDRPSWAMYNFSDAVEAR